MELLSALGLEWHTFIAQLINYGILFGALTFLLYRPILRLLDDRQARIRASMDDVVRIERQRKEMEEIRRSEMQKIEQEAGVLLEQAKATVAKEKDRLLETARRESEELLARSKQSLEAERVRITSDMEKAASAMILRLTQALLEREFGPTDQDRLLKTLESSLSHHAK